MKFRPQISFKIQAKLQLQRLAVDNAKDLHLEHFTINHLNSQVRRAKDGRHIKINDSTFSEVSESSGYLDLSAEK